MEPVEAASGAPTRLAWRQTANGSICKAVLKQLLRLHHQQARPLAGSKRALSCAPCNAHTHTTAAGHGKEADSARKELFAGAGELLFGRKGNQQWHDLDCVDCCRGRPLRMWPLTPKLARRLAEVLHLRATRS